MSTADDLRLEPQKRAVVGGCRARALVIISLQPARLTWTSQAIKQLLELHLAGYIQHFCQFRWGIRFSTTAPGTSDECCVC